MTDERIPVAIHSETISVCGVDIVVHVLDDGRRIIGAEALDQLLNELGFTVEDDE